jgi:uncharacterized membrane protein YdjX (TVP38/TMEM64 family)
MPKKQRRWQRYIPVAIIVIGLALFYYFRLYDYLSFEQLQANHQKLQNWTQLHPIVSALSFIGIYIVLVAFSFPGATILTLIGGFLFGIVFGTLYIIVAATIGASLIFLAAKTAFADVLEKKAGKWLVKFEKGFQQNAFGYLLFLRLLPLFPFWLINIVPAFLNVRLRTFVLSTFLGIIPGTAVYVAVGNGLGSVFEKGQTPNFGIIFEPQILIPLVLLAVLAVLPMVYKKFKKRQRA